MNACGNPYVQELKKICSYTYRASSMIPTPVENITDASLLDIAPTIASIMGVESDRDWEGRSLINREV